MCLSSLYVSCFSYFQVHSFLITNLAIGDFFMGVYLLIIAVVDSYYRGVYSAYEKGWKTSSLCQFSGFISTFSSELSVLTLTVITLDRLICIIFPLKVCQITIYQIFSQFTSHVEKYFTPIFQFPINIFKRIFSIDFNSYNA